MRNSQGTTDAIWRNSIWQVNIGAWAGSGDERSLGLGVDKQSVFLWCELKPGDLREGDKKAKVEGGGALDDMEMGGGPLADPFTRNKFVAQQNVF